MFHFKWPGSYHKIFKSHRHFIPYRKKKKSEKSAERNHWLSGKNSSFFEENHVHLNNNQITNIYHNSDYNACSRAIAIDFCENQDLPLISEDISFVNKNSPYKLSKKIQIKN